MFCYQLLYYYFCVTYKEWSIWQCFLSSVTKFSICGKVKIISFCTNPDSFLVDHSSLWQNGNSTPKQLDFDYNGISAWSHVTVLLVQVFSPLLPRIFKGGGFRIKGQDPEQTFIFKMFIDNIIFSGSVSFTAIYFFRSVPCVLANFKCLLTIRSFHCPEICLY